ncbi:hypothetical protein HAAEEKHM_00043 [Sinorhizobium phage AP-16-3]|nr:hypothetical protein HAAEEKHM_00043 [Sinorhizobium phage AP-16-3]
MSGEGDGVMEKAICAGSAVFLGLFSVALAVADIRTGALTMAFLAGVLAALREVA